MIVVAGRPAGVKLHLPARSTDPIAALPAATPFTSGTGAAEPAAGTGVVTPAAASTTATTARSKTRAMLELLVLAKSSQ